MAPSPLACGMCMFDSFQDSFPATMAWSLIVPAWYLALCAFARRNDIELTMMRSFWKSGLLVAAALVLGVAFLGPILLIPFGPICAVASVQYFRAAGGLGGGPRLVGHSIGVVAILALGITAVTGFVEASAPVTVDAILRQPSNAGVRRTAFRKLLAAEPGSLPVYRELVVRASDTGVLWSALGRLEALGRPEAEVPFLIDCLEVRLRGKETVQAGLVEDALRRMSGCDPEPDTGATGWREAWRRKSGGR